jgi:hypothetical protein
MNIVSLLTPEEVEKMGGLPPRATCGAFESEKMDPDKFIVNKEFVEFMHGIIGDKGPGVPSLREAAQRQMNGYLYIIDLRTPKGVMGNVPPEDIIGAFKVEDQKLVANSYWRNESHKIFSRNGLVKLPPEIFKLIIDELKSKAN